VENRKVYLDHQPDAQLFDNKVDAFASLALARVKVPGMSDFPGDAMSVTN
jgi:hypothetical protein